MIKEAMDERIREAVKKRLSLRKKIRSRVRPRSSPLSQIIELQKQEKMNSEVIIPKKTFPLSNSQEYDRKNLSHDNYKYLIASILDNHNYNVSVEHNMFRPNRGYCRPDIFAKNGNHYIFVEVIHSSWSRKNVWEYFDEELGAWDLPLDRYFFLALTPRAQRKSSFNNLRPVGNIFNWCKDIPQNCKLVFAPYTTSNWIEKSKHII